MLTTTVGASPESDFVTTGLARAFALKGQWRGARSSALSRQWRVLYAVVGDELTVFVLEVNPHDYRKKD